MSLIMSAFVPETLEPAPTASVANAPEVTVSIGGDPSAVSTATSPAAPASDPRSSSSALSDNLTTKIRVFASTLIICFSVSFSITLLSF
jgi:hypothetical protein